MSILMGLTLSFFQSLINILRSGHFTVPGWLISFVISAAVSLIISYAVPMKKVNDAVEKKFSLEPRSAKAHIAESLVSDLIYTPIMTLVMTFLAWRNASSAGAPVQFLPMFLNSLWLSLIVGFVLVYFLQPIYTDFLMRQNGPRNTR